MTEQELDALQEEWHGYGWNAALDTLLSELREVTPAAITVEGLLTRIEELRDHPAPVRAEGALDAELFLMTNDADQVTHSVTFATGDYVTATVMSSLEQITRIDASRTLTDGKTIQTREGKWYAPNELLKWRH